MEMKMVTGPDMGGMGEEKPIEVVAERSGDLRGNLSLIHPTTWQTSDEVFLEWQAGAPVVPVVTANFAAYKLINREPVLNLIGIPGNPFLSPEEPGSQWLAECVSRRGHVNTLEPLVIDEEYHLYRTIKEGKTFEIKLNELNLKGAGPGEDMDNKEFFECFLKVSPDNSSLEKKVVKAVFGTPEPGHGKKIQFLKPSVVVEEMEKKRKRYGDRIEKGLIIIPSTCAYYSDDLFLTTNTFHMFYETRVMGARMKPAVHQLVKLPERSGDYDFVQLYRGGVPYLRFMSRFVGGAQVAVRKFCDEIGVQYEEADSPFPRGEKICLLPAYSHFRITGMGSCTVDLEHKLAVVYEGSAAPEDWHDRGPRSVDAYGLNLNMEHLKRMERRLPGWQIVHGGSRVKQ